MRSGPPSASGDAPELVGVPGAIRAACRSPAVTRCAPELARDALAVLTGARCCAMLDRVFAPGGGAREAELAGAVEAAAGPGLRLVRLGEALFVADGGNGRVQKRWLTEPERAVAESSGELEGLPEPLRRPEGLALADGALYVSDRLRHRILVRVRVRVRARVRVRIRVS